MFTRKSEVEGQDGIESVMTKQKGKSGRSLRRHSGLYSVCMYFNKDSLMVDNFRLEFDIGVRFEISFQS